jgi:23S rRNA pseudouridine1911/1915/1917 synthase
MVIAKTESMFVWLKEQFQQRTIKKEYRAFVHGVIQEKEGKVDRAIGRSASDFRKYSAQRGAKGMLRDAVTRYTILARITENTANWDEWNPQGYSYIALHPETGRTHQLRVHMKSIHHPVVADELYGGSLGKGLGFSRLALHAFRLTVPFPDGSTASFEAPLREDFIKVIEQSA